jgi:NADH-quinone oxidoreductase subunit K
MITITDGLIVSAIVFSISLIGMVLNRHNLIVLLMCVELMLLAVNTNFILFSHFLNDLAGQIFVFFILAVAAAETAIGLAILIIIFRNKKTINVDELDSLKG